ncbi:hypothetical protein A9Q90_03785 [Gammaproteobacteria bacterium 54_18_T64]|mgnify:CR=1 FL=1|nr:hypothetical protein A9Q90_03785 [Gammaproteobacteria bacterium 54_18_T64]
MQNVKSYEQAQETLTLIKILALGNRQIEEGKIQLASEAIQDTAALCTAKMDTIKKPPFGGFVILTITTSENSILHVAEEFRWSLLFGH